MSFEMIENPVTGEQGFLRLAPTADDVIALLPVLGRATGPVPGERNR